MKLFALYAILAITLTSCTISMQNISTKGTASDLIDEEQTASPSTDVTATIPLK